MRCAVGRTVGEKAPLRAQQPIARVSQRAPGTGLHVQSLTLYLDGKAKAEREVPGGRYSLAIISYIVSNRELDRALRSDEKVATPQEQELKKEALHLPACIPLMFQRPAPQHTATAERLHLC